MMNKFLRIFAVVLACTLSLSLFGCAGKDDGSTQDVLNDDSDGVSSTPDEIDKNNDQVFYNKLTGESVSKDLSGKRPVAIMINNIKVSCPQMGISKADVIYECLAEGGITRMLMLADDYADLPIVGSIRSSRDYYLDFAADFDAIYVHAGGSPIAYDQIKDRKVNNVDGVEGPSALWSKTKTFYRDQDRIKNMGYEHSVMTTGEGIVAGIEYMGYRTDLKSNYDSPFDFVSPDTMQSFTDSAKHVRFAYSSYQIVDYVFNEQTGKYLRFQHDGNKHIDGATNEQLSFENVIIMFCKTANIENDEKNKITVTTTGTGKGYYITNGTYIPITWSKSGRDSQVKYFKADGTALELNRGKTFVNVCKTDVDVEFNYSK